MQVSSGISVRPDVVMTAAIVGSAFVLAWVLLAVQRVLDARWARPYLPADDRPPAGLGRLVPVGAQVENECRRGMAALESWRLSVRQAGHGGT
jgi:hypothetical protein